MRLFTQILIAIGVVVVLAAVLFPVFAKAKEGGKQPCLGNIKRSAAGLIVYSADYDDRLPSRDRWMDGAFLYEGKEELLHCPTVAKQNPAQYGYAFNSRLSFQKIPKDANAVPMIYDSINLARNASDPVTSLPVPGRHNWDTANYMAYADGHAQILTRKP